MLRKKIGKDIERLEQEIDEFFDEFLIERPMWNPTLKCLEPLTHVHETEDKFTVTVDLPYVKKEDIKLDLTPNELKIEAQMCKDILYARWGTIQRHCVFQTFQKEIRFLIEVVPELVKARFKEGFLIIEIPKKTRRYKIPIE